MLSLPTALVGSNLISAGETSGGFISMSYIEINPPDVSPGLVHALQQTVRGSEGRVGHSEIGGGGGTHFILFLKAGCAYLNGL